MVQWTLHVVGAGFFAIVIPRMMGPEVFGRYALLTSVAMWFAFLSGLGAISVLTRTIPQLMHAGDIGAVRKLATSLVALRGITGVPAALAYTCLITLAFGFDDWPSVLFIALAVWCRPSANITFALFLGLNNAARWGMGDLLRRWLILIFVIVGFPIAGLRGACAGFFAANLIVLGVGFAQASSYLRWRELDLSRQYLRPFIRTGTSFAAGNLLIALVQRSGESIVSVAHGDYAEVGYFGAAYAIYLTFAQVLWQSAIAFAPLLVNQIQGGEIESVKAWLSRILKWMLIVVTFVASAITIVGRDLVPLLLGPAYEPVTSNLVPLSLALFSLSVGGVGRLAVLTLDRPKVLVMSAGLELSIFWTLGLTSAAWGGSFAVCVSAAVASACYATWMTVRIRRELPYPPRAPLSVIARGLVFLPLVWSPFDLVANLALFAAAAVLFVWLLWRDRIVTLEEIRTLRRVARPAPSPA